jgi:excisionase family DNA binding protein
MKCDYYTIGELVIVYKLKYRTIWNWIQNKKLKAVKVNGRLRILKSSWKKLLKDS